MAFTRGGVDQDFRELPYKNIMRPTFPIDPDMVDPELNVIMIPPVKYYYGRQIVLVVFYCSTYAALLQQVLQHYCTGIAALLQPELQ